MTIGERQRTPLFQDPRILDTSTDRQPISYGRDEFVAPPGSLKAGVRRELMPDACVAWPLESRAAVADAQRL